MNQALSHFHILGSGSIGLLLAVKVISSFPNAPITILLRPRHRKRIRSSKDHPCSHILVQLKSLIKKPSSSTIVSIPAQIIGEQESKVDNNKIKNIILCTKAVDAIPALLSIKDQMTEKSNVLILCNGAMAVQRHIQNNHSLRSINTSLGTTYHGAYLSNNIDQEKSDVLYRTVNHAGSGQLYTTDPLLSSFFQKCDLNGELLNKEDMKIVLWKKLAANAVINPLTAIYQCLNGELIPSCTSSSSLQKKQHDVISKQMKQIIEEVAQVAILELSSSSLSNNDLLNYNSFYNFVYSVLEATRENKSSMYQDIILRRQKSEIDFINGYIVQLGSQYGVDTPLNRQMCKEISNLEKDFDSK